MNRREFAGTTLAGLGGLFFAQRLEGGTHDIVSEDRIKKSKKKSKKIRLLTNNDRHGHKWVDRGHCVCPFICEKCKALSGSNKALKPCLAVFNRGGER